MAILAQDDLPTLGTEVAGTFKSADRGLRCIHLTLRRSTGSGSIAGVSSASLGQEANGVLLARILGRDDDQSVHIRPDARGIGDIYDCCHHERLAGRE